MVRRCTLGNMKADLKATISAINRYCRAEPRPFAGNSLKKRHLWNILQDKDGKKKKLEKLTCLPSAQFKIVKYNLIAHASTF